MYDTVALLGRSSLKRQCSKCAADWRETAALYYGIELMQRVKLHALHKVWCVTQLHFYDKMIT